MATFIYCFYPKRFTRFLPLIHPATYTLTYWWQQANTHGAGQPLGAIWGSVSCPRTLWHVDRRRWGLNVVIYRLERISAWYLECTRLVDATANNADIWYIRRYPVEKPPTLWSVDYRSTSWTTATSLKLPLLCVLLLILAITIIRQPLIQQQYGKPILGFPLQVQRVEDDGREVGEISEWRVAG